MATIARVVKVSPKNTVMLVCDLQTRLKPVVYAFDNVVATANKMLKVAKVLNVPVVVTEQNPKGLGPTTPELALSTLGPLHLGTFAKSLFSMITPQVTQVLTSREPPIKSVVLYGIESHVCILQTALDLLELQYDVHVLADGVSSCNKEEIPWALERMRQAGAQITTSESIAFQLTVDSASPNFKPLAGIVKEEKDATKSTLQTLLPVQSK
ncbi:Isochorismatase-like protein [Hysterangium stoloniferum]|nr:Isochorismatase-like protein [Hysterangium stoloniferum]